MTWVFYLKDINFHNLIEYILNVGICNNRDVIMLDEADKVINIIEDIDEVTFALKIDPDLYSFVKERGVKVTLLWSDPLNIHYWIIEMLKIIEMYPGIHIYDYSKSNTQLYVKFPFDTFTVEYLPYGPDKDEIDRLSHMYKTIPKDYDVGIIASYNTVKDDYYLPSSRSMVYNYIIECLPWVRVALIAGWGDDRDIDIAKCRKILNIHFQWSFVDKITIFEHVRCNRLLYAGIPVLSEESFMLDNEFTQMSNLQLIPYEEFFTPQVYICD